jgi:hypothetical protein
MGAGVENVGGDMFVSVPQADAVFMKVSYLFIYLNHYEFTLIPHSIPCHG